MGEHAREVQEALAEGLAATRPGLEWTLEERVGGTPVDVVGRGDDRLVLVELEWRRADPADNAAKLFRHLAEEAVPASGRSVLVVQAFTEYYHLASGGVSSKRENAEFVGEAAAEQLEPVAYRPVDLAIDPPKAGGQLPSEWVAAVDGAVAAVDEAIDASLVD